MVLGWLALGVEEVQTAKKVSVWAIEEDGLWIVVGEEGVEICQICTSIKILHNYPQSSAFTLHNDVASTLNPQTFINFVNVNNLKFAVF